MGGFHQESAMNSDRRTFLKDSMVLAAAPVIVPASARGANDRLAFGLIGSGLRGRFVSRVCQEFGAQCVAMCDVYEPRLQLGLKESPGAKSYVEYRDLLQQEGIDFVIVATPDHQHYPNLMAALEAGKDVYLEKPMSHAKKIEAVRRTDRIVQVGMHRRSSHVIFEAKEVIDEGVLGKIRIAKTRWKNNRSRPLSNEPLEGKLDWERFLGPAPKRPFEPMRFRRWRSFWDYAGGNLADQGTHLMDVIQWFTGAKAPISASCVGFVARMTGAEAPEVLSAVYEYPDFVAEYTLSYCNDYQDHWSFEFQGEEATLLINNQGFSVYKEPWLDNREPIIRVVEKVRDEQHVENFLECIKTRKDPNAPVEIGASAVNAVHLANIAWHQGRRVRLAADGLTVS
jgi:predicted dehydrogenase